MRSTRVKADDIIVSVDADTVFELQTVALLVDALVRSDAARAASPPRHRLTRAQILADEDDHRRHALCVQILVNAVQVWKPAT